MTTTAKLRRRAANTHAPDLTLADVRDAVTRLRPAVAAASHSTDRDRRPSEALMADLKETGVFRVLLPRAVGGVGATLPEALGLFEEIASADASTGWLAALGAVAWTDLAALPRSTFEQIWEGRPNAMISLVFAPGGSATSTADGGYEVTGRWAFASGCEHADWIAGSTIDDAGGMRLVLFEPDQVTIEDTWHVAGLRGSGSHHFSASAVRVPAERTLAVFVDPPCLDDPAPRLHPTALVGTAIAAVALGAARGALEDICETALTKTPLLSPSTLSQHATFHAVVGEADTTIRASRAVLQESAQMAWDIASEDRPPTDAERARMRGGAAWVVDRCAAVVSAAYHSGGGSALYDSSPLQRRFRDVHAITQHFLVRPDTMAKAGALLLGEEIDLAVF